MKVGKEIGWTWVNSRLLMQAEHTSTADLLALDVQGPSGAYSGDPRLTQTSTPLQLTALESTTKTPPRQGLCKLRIMRH